jgi:hypothetical protein
VAAVIAGFVILRSITKQTAASDAAGGDVATATVAASTVPSTEPSSTTSTTAATTTTTTTTTTIPPDEAKSGATVVVANASGIGGTATSMRTQLAAAGYVVTPVANGKKPWLDHTVIYYVGTDPGALAVAQLLAQQIPGAQTLPMPDPPPLDRPLGKATVALMLGRDAAGHRLADLRTG